MSAVIDTTNALNELRGQVVATRGRRLGDVQKILTAIYALQARIDNYLVEIGRDPDCALCGGVGWLGTKEPFECSCVLAGLTVEDEF